MCYLVSPFVCKVVKGVFISFLLLSKTLSRVSCSLFTPGMRSGQSPRCWNFFRLSPSLSALKPFPPSISLRQSPSFLLPLGSVWRNPRSIFTNRTVQIRPQRLSDFPCTFTPTHFVFPKIRRLLSPFVFVAPPGWKNDTCLFFLRRLLKLKYQNLSLLSCEYLLSAPVTPPPSSCLSTGNGPTWNTTPLRDNL